MAGLRCCVCGEGTSLAPVVIEDEQAMLVDHSDNSITRYGKVRVRALTNQDRNYYSYGIFTCQCCGERIVVRKKYHDGNWEAVYPIPHVNYDDAIPEPIRGQAVEASLCFNVDAYGSSAAMCQIALESTWREQGVSRLNDLMDKGTIPKILFDRATEIRLWANVVKHEPIDESVSKEDAEELLSYLTMILDHVYVQPSRLDVLKQKRKELEGK